MAATTLLTTKEKLERYLSLRGLLSFSDHEECGEIDCDVIDDAIRRASGEIIGYIYPLYTAASLAGSDLVCDWATALAAFYLTKRRGNTPPESLYEEYERIMGRPDGIVWQTRNGNFLLECAKKQSHDTPTHSNVTVDRRYNQERIRVVRGSSSTVPTEAEQDIEDTRRRLF